MHAHNNNNNNNNKKEKKKKLITISVTKVKKMLSICAYFKGVKIDVTKCKMLDILHKI